MGIGKKEQYSTRAGVVAGIIVLITASSSRGDAFYNWTMMSGVQRIGYVNPFFKAVNSRAESGSEAGHGYVTDLRLLRLTLQKALLERLSLTYDQRQALLTGVGGDRPARHQALHNAIDWS